LVDFVAWGSFDSALPRSGLALRSSQRGHRPIWCGTSASLQLARLVAFGPIFGAAPHQMTECLTCAGKALFGAGWEFLGDLLVLLILDCIQQSKPARQFKIGNLASFSTEHS